MVLKALSSGGIQPRLRMLRWNPLRAYADVYITGIWHTGMVLRRSSVRIYRKFGVVVFEGLNIRKMARNHCLAKSTSDAAWNMLVTTIQNKAESAGFKVALIDPQNTSKICSS